MEDGMKTQRKGAARTPRSLLAAASEVFAEKGYQGATIAEICKRAGANIAAVNYHFGDKETLYREAWRHSFSESVKAHPPDGGVSESAPPEERLRGQVAALLSRIADEDNREFLIVQKELANPTGLLNEVTREALMPLQQRLEILLRELLGPHVSDMEVGFCGISIITQCINPMVVRRGRKRKRDNQDGPPGIDDIDAYTNHVVEFSLAGIRAIREEAEKKRRNFKRQRRSANALKRE
jgi:TetR/AcrR family transcriptional regulator, regulator of cefoperazone and chloramphenicol sensitivity